MRFLLLIAALPLVGCAALPTTFHNPTVDGFAGEVGPLVTTDEDPPAEDVTSEGQEKTKTKGKGGAVGLLQFRGFYTKMEAAPLPGMWVGWGLTDNRPGKFGWYPAIEVTGSSSSNKNADKDESKDGFLTDDAGNRYLYEIKRTHSGMGLAIPQLFEIYPARRFAVFTGFMPAFLSEESKTTVEMVYENDRRIVKADPVLDAKFRDIQEYEQRNDKDMIRYTMPISAGVRFGFRDFHMRIAATTHRVDSVKNYDNAFKDVFFVTFGYAPAPRRTFNVNQDPPPSEPQRQNRQPQQQSQPQPQPQPQGQGQQPIFQPNINLRIGR